MTVFRTQIMYSTVSFMMQLTGY